MSAPRAALSASVARSLDATPELLPWLDELLADVDELGGDAREVVEIARSAGVAPLSRAIDLGCGKGAIALALARELACDVLGVDGHAPFVERARAAARTVGLAHAARFEVGDFERVAVDRPFDLGLAVAVAPVPRALAAVRRCVRPGGLMVIDDGFLAGGVAEDASCAGHRRTLERLRAHGDELLGERVVDAAHEAARNRAITAAIAERAARLARQHPELAGAFERYVRTQQHESERAGMEVISATWWLRRGV